MTKRLEVYRCDICGNIVEVLHTGKGQLVCCGQPMQLLSASTEDEGYEKHVPVVEKVDGGVRVKVGSAPHPMLDRHYIEWIQVVAGGKSCRQFLEPGSLPEAVFMLEAGDATARQYCNLHGLWRSG